MKIYFEKNTSDLELKIVELTMKISDLKVKDIPTQDVSRGAPQTTKFKPESVEEVEKENPEASTTDQSPKSVSNENVFDSCFTVKDKWVGKVRHEGMFFFSRKGQ